MADPSPGRDAPAGMPRWFKVFAIVAAVVVVVFVVALLGGGEHGPGRHSRGVTAPLPLA